jgi:TonB family protein
MKTSPLLVQLCAAVVLAAPLSLLGAINDEMIKELKLTQFVEPVFPDSLRVDGVGEGSVTLAISRTPAGEPADILVLASTHPKLVPAALDAVRQWRFAPTGNAADLAPCTIRLGFKLQGVIFYPFGKNHEAELTMATASLVQRSPVNVPRLRTLSQVPKALSQPMPVYPAALVPRGLKGTAAVRFYVDEEGRVRLPEVIDATAPEFAAAAVAAVSQWRYEPPRINGRNIVAYDHWEFKFQAAN